jgi:hypothetical protein
MLATRHTDPDAFLAAVAPMAARGEASASFFSGWAHMMKITPPRPDEHLYLATCTADGVLGAALQRDVGPVIVGASDVAAAVAFADDLSRDWPQLQGVVGAPAGSQAFARRWHELTGRTHALRVRLRQHMLTSVEDVPAASGAPRVATDADIEWLAAVQTAFIAELGIPDSLERMLALMPRRVALGHFWIWEDPEPVAYAGFSDAAPDFARVAPVYTLPDRRRKGYATALVAALSRELLARGKPKLFLTTDAANATSNAIYARIGYRPQNEDCHFDFVAPAE